MGKCPTSGGGRRSRLPTFQPLLSSPPTSSGLYQPAQSVCHSRKESRRYHYQHSWKRMAKRLKGNVGKYVKGGCKTAWGRCGGGSIRGTSFSGLYIVSASLECSSPNNLYAKTVMEDIARFPAYVFIDTTHESDGYLLPWLRPRFASDLWQLHHENLHKQTHSYPSFFIIFPLQWASCDLRNLKCRKTKSLF
jgi:hypothetical protein